jgi:hypothetical protein
MTAEPPLTPTVSVVATPRIGSPTTSMSGWPVPRRTARRIEAWHEVNELPDRELMRDGRWLI